MKQKITIKNNFSTNDNILILNMDGEIIESAKANEFGIAEFFLIPNNIYRVEIRKDNSQYPMLSNNIWVSTNSNFLYILRPYPRLITFRLMDRFYPGLLIAKGEFLL